MAKDPAVLLYTNDFLAGTFTMSNAQVGAYIRLLCIQHQQGHLKEETMLSICKKHDPVIWSKFKQDENGLYFNERMEIESLRRHEFHKKQSDKAAKRWQRKNESSDEDANEHTAGYAAAYAPAQPGECLLGNGNGINKNNIDLSSGLDKTTDARANDLSRVMTLYLDRINSQPSPSCVDMLKFYTEDMGGDVVCRAIEIAIDEKATSWSYIRAILQNWARKRVKSLADVERIEAEWQKAKEETDRKAEKKKHVQASKPLPPEEQKKEFERMQKYLQHLREE